ncbi:MAG: LuxR C-terminal-related transcriptional regulator [Dehalococcoidia bacterium]|nr:LuxR C-terminal-related transcriptional regulator [Dehalococcoidia bacterium]
MSINRMLDLMNEAPYGVYAVDMDQKIVFWNHSAERILGYKRSDVIGLRCYEVCASLPEEGTEPVCMEGCPSIQLAREGIIPPVIHVRMLCSSGERKPVSVTPLIIHRGDDDERNLLVHLFHEKVNDARAKSVAENVHSVLSTKLEPGEAPHDRHRPLTVREIQVLRLLAMALEAGEIAERLELSSHTILNHIRNARMKLNAKNRLEAVLAAQRRGLL